MFKPQRLVWILAFLYFAFNLGFFSYNYDMDGAVFSLYLEAVKAGADPATLFHNHHLIYEPFAYGFWNLLTLAGLSMRSVHGLQLFDLVLSGFSLAIFGLSLVSIRPEKKWVALLCELGLGFSFTYWFFSVQPGEHALALLFLNLGFYFAVKNSHGLNDFAPPGRKNFVILMLGVLASLAAFGHIMHGLFVIPVLAFALRIFPAPKLRSRLRPLLAILVVFCMITGSLYVIAFFAQTRVSPHVDSLTRTFIKWVLGNASIETPYGYSHSYWENGFASLGQWFSGLVWAFFWKDENSVAPRVWRLLKISGLSVMTIYVLNYLYRYFKDWRKREAYDDFIMAWIIPGALFTTFWAPGYFEQKTYLLPALWAMVFMGVPGTKSKMKKTALVSLLAMTVISLFAFNFFLKIYPDSDPENAPELETAEQIKNATAPGSIIIISGAAAGYNIGKVYIPYFSQRSTLVLDWVLSKPVDGKYFPQNLEKAIDDYMASGKTVYLLSDALQGPALDELSEHHRISKKELASFWARYNHRPVAKLEGGLLLYQIE